jgi:hypothetical protein
MFDTRQSVAVNRPTRSIEPESAHRLTVDAKSDISATGFFKGLTLALRAHLFLPYGQLPFAFVTEKGDQS